MYRNIEEDRDLLARPPRRGAPDYELRTKGPPLKEATWVPSDTPTEFRDASGMYWKLQF